MATGTILDMFQPDTAEVAGTQRVERITNEPYDQQIRYSGMSVIDAMLSAGRDKLVELASGTAVGQNIIQTAIAQQQQNFWQQYGTLILLGGAVLLFLVGMAFGRR